MSGYINTKVLVFDHLLFKNDIDTPLSMTMKPATVVAEDDKTVDVIFDHRPEIISHNHFKWAIRDINWFVDPSSI
jgi:hypothetical protein